MDIPQSRIDAFWANVDRQGQQQCWPWLLTLKPSGYARIVIRGKRYRVHRLAYELSVGPIPEGHELHHVCEVKHCCNPAHLEVMTKEAHSRMHHIHRWNSRQT